MMRKRNLQVWLSLFVIGLCLVYLGKVACDPESSSLVSKSEISECHFLLKNSYVDQPNGRNLILAGARALKESLPQSLKGREDWTARFERGTEEESLRELEALVDAIAQEGRLEHEAAVYQVLDGMVKSLKDPYTIAMDPKTYARFQETLHSQPFGGVGLQIGRSKGEIIVFSVLPETPAAAADIRVGDVLVSVEEREVRELAVEDVEALLHGEPGSDVFCRFAREGQRFERTLKRVELKTRSVQGRILEIPDGPKIAWLSVNAFQSDTGTLMGEELAKVLSEAPSFLILDLRDNVGGYVTAALEVASYFLPSGRTVVEIVARDESDSKSTVSVEPVELPLLVLVNRRTASSAEILAACLQDHQRAQLVGEVTFGKGSVQSLHEFDSGGGLKYTTARYKTPKGRALDDGGLRPDLEMEEIGILNYCKEQWKRKK